MFETEFDDTLKVLEDILKEQEESKELNKLILEELKKISSSLYFIERK